MWAATPRTVDSRAPVIECYADTIIEVGALGMGHTLKLINNFISIGTCAVISEAAATAAKVGVDMRKFYEVISAGGANSKMFQMVMPWVLEGDDSHLKGPLRIAGKDMRFYAKLAEQAPAAAFIAQAVNQTLHLFNTRGHGDRFLPVLPGLHGRVERREDPRSLTRRTGFASVAAMGENATTSGLPLSGVTVVEFCHSVAGPYAGSILADLGADVIKVEAPDKRRLRARLGAAVRARHLDAVPRAQSQQARAGARSARPRDRASG